MKSHEVELGVHKRFDRRIAVVTGAAGGLGLEYAEVLGEEGASVVAVDIASDALTGAVGHLRSKGVMVDGLSCDLADEQDVDRLVSHCERSFGRVDILVNNAGGDQPFPAPIEEFPFAQWRSIVDRNLTTAFLCCRGFAPLMKKQRAGKILNISSRAARTGGWYSDVTVAYVAAKAGVLGLTKQTARELGPFGINVNCMVPSFTISGPLLQQHWDEMSDDERSQMLKSSPLGRLPERRELAMAVAFLCSDESSYITGSALDVNGGTFMG